MTDRFGATMSDLPCPTLSELSTGRTTADLRSHRCLALSDVGRSARGEPHGGDGRGLAPWSAPRRTRSTPASVTTREELGADLTALRLRAGLTVRQLATRAGLPSATVGGWVNARHLPGQGQLDQFRLLLEACGVDRAEHQAVARCGGAGAPVQRRPGDPIQRRGRRSLPRPRAVPTRGRRTLLRAQRLHRARARPTVPTRPAGVGSSDTALAVRRRRVRLGQVVGPARRGLPGRRRRRAAGRPPASPGRSASSRPAPIRSMGCALRCRRCPSPGW